jgi:hypothetical protein
MRRNHNGCPLLEPSFVWGRLEIARPNRSRGSYPSVGCDKLVTSTTWAESLAISNAVLFPYFHPMKKPALVVKVRLTRESGFILIPAGMSLFYSKPSETEHSSFVQFFRQEAGNDRQQMAHAHLCFTSMVKSSILERNRHPGGRHRDHVSALPLAGKPC